MRNPSRLFHRWFAPWLFLLLAVSAITGVAYRAGKTWFGLNGGTGQSIMEIHTGEWIHPAFSPFYVLIVGGGLLLLLSSGAVLLRQQTRAQGARLWHRIFGLILILPLTATAVTGILYKLGQEWFDFSEDTSRLLMVIHEGRWLGPTLRPFYVTLLGLGVLALGSFGLRLVRFPRRKPTV